MTMLTPDEKHFQKSIEEACESLRDMANEACSRSSAHEVWYYISTAHKLEGMLRTTNRWIENKRPSAS